MKLPRPLSHSSITLYGECPRKYKFRYVDEVPEKPRHFFSYGQSVHAALEFFYGVPMPEPPPLTDLLKSYRQTWVSKGYRSESEEAEYFDQGKTLLTEFHRKHSKDFKRPLFVEYEFSLEVDGVPVRGFIDRIDALADGRLAVIDYKTGKKLATTRIDVDPQLTMYQLACESALGTEVGELIFYHLPSLQEHRARRRSAALVEELRRRIVDTADSIERERFEPRPDEMVCRWCDYKPLCPIFKDQYAGVPVPPARAAGEPELAALVDRYGAALAKAEESRLEAEKAGAELRRALVAKGYVRAFGARYEAALSAAVKWDFADKKKVLERIRKAGLYEKVLAPSAPLVHKLLEDPSTDAALRAELSGLGERIDASELQIKAL